MKYRVARILAEESLSASGTKTIDLKVAEPISRIELRYKYTKGSDAMIAHPAKDITKIELVDGSDVLHSLSGYENQGLCIYDRKVPTMCHGQHLTACSEEIVLGIDFGRFLWDPLLALDPKKFANPQLKITYDSDLSDASSTSPVLEVFGYLFDEKAITPTGFLMSKELYNAACPAENSYKYVELPTDYPIRQMIIRGFEDAHEPWDAVKEIRLDEDNRKRIPFDYEIEEYLRMMKGVWQAVEEMCIMSLTTSARIFYVTPTDYYATLIANALGGASTLYPATWQPGGKFSMTAGSTQSAMGVARGYLPNHCIQFPFGLPGEPDDWYDVTKKGSIRLRVKGGSEGASAEFQVALQQLRKY